MAWDVSRVSHGAASPTEAATKRAGNKAVRPDARLVGDFINGIGRKETLEQFSPERDNLQLEGTGYALEGADSLDISIPY